ncbi:MAG: hypothetical protein WC914_07230 [Proteiniphilum sp.]
MAFRLFIKYFAVVASSFGTAESSEERLMRLVKGRQQALVERKGRIVE